MSNDSLKKIYEEHHANDREAGFTILERERGELFKSVIGEHKAVLDTCMHLEKEGYGTFFPLVFWLCWYIQVHISCILYKDILFWSF